MTFTAVRMHILPAIDVLKRRLQSPAMLEAIFMPEWLFRRYSYNAYWGEGEEVAALRSAGSDTLYALFTPAGAVLKVFEHDDPYAEPSLLSLLPAPLARFANEPAFEPHDVSFCCWRLQHDASWAFAGASLDAAARLLMALVAEADEYARRAEQYYNRCIAREAVAQVFSFAPLTPELTAKLNADADLREVKQDAVEIGYPLAGVWAVRTSQ
jgi:hypothetical protein